MFACMAKQGSLTGCGVISALGRMLQVYLAAPERNTQPMKIESS